MKYVKNLIQIIGIIQISIGSTCLNLASATSVSGKEFSEQLTQFNVKLIGKQVCNEKNLRSSNENSFDYKLDHINNGISHSLSSSQSDCEQTPGVYQEIMSFLSAYEADEAIPSKDYYTILSLFSNAYSEGFKHRRNLENYLSLSNESSELKEETILSYYRNVYTPLVTLNFIFGTIFGRESHSGIDLILKEISSDLFQENTKNYFALINAGDLASGVNFFEIERGENFLSLNPVKSALVQNSIKLLGQSNNSKAYVSALRLISVQMLIGQLTNAYILKGGADKEINLPKACSERLENGVFSRSQKIDFDESLHHDLRNGLLYDWGLIYNPYSLESYQASIGEIENEFLNEAHFGRDLIFDQYKRVSKSIYEDALDKNSSIRPQLSMFSIQEAYSDVVLSKIFNETITVYKTASRSRPGVGKRIMQNKDYSLFENIFTAVQSGSVGTVKNRKTGEKKEIDFSILNVSEYLRLKMIEKGVFYPEELLTKTQIQDLKRNLIKINLPSLNGPVVQRRWGLNLLKHKIKTYIKNNKSTKIFDTNCRGNTSQFCVGKWIDLNNALTLISEIEGHNALIPNLGINEEDFEDDYTTLHDLWVKLRDDYSLLNEAYISEFDFLKHQMLMQNEIAMIKLGFLVASNELANMKNSILKNKKVDRRGRRTNLSEVKKVNQLEKNLIKYSEISGMNKSFGPQFILNLNKELLKEIYSKKLEEFEGQSSYLFFEKGKRTHVENLKKISNTLILIPEAVNYMVHSSLNSKVSPFLYRKIEDGLNSLDSERTSFLLQLLKEKNNKKRMQLFEQNAEQFGFYDQLNLKEDILFTDSSLKTPLLEEVIVQAAEAKKKKIYKSLKNLCETDLTDHEKLKEFFYSSLKAQSQLNQSVGGIQVPKALMKRVEAATFEENMNMVKGMGAFVVGAGALALVGACGMSFGTLCGAAIYIGSVAGGLLGASSFKSELEIKLRSDKAAERTEAMESLGLTDYGAAEQVSTSWAWAIMASLDVIPLAGIVTRGINLGAKITRQNLNLTMKWLKSGKRLNRYDRGVMAKTALIQEEIKLSKVVLGLDDSFDFFKLNKKKYTPEDLYAISKQIGNRDLSNEVEKLNKLKAFLSDEIFNLKAIEIVNKAKKISLEADLMGKSLIFDKTILSLDEIDDASAKTLTQFFYEKPSYLQAYLKKSMDKVERQGAQARKNYLDANKKNMPFLEKILKSAWNENTYSVAKRKTTLRHLLNEANMVRDKDEMLLFFKKNVESFTEVFSKTPMGYGDIPYLLIQGSGDNVDRLIRKSRVFKNVGENIMLRNISQARLRLVAESIKGHVRAELGTVAFARSQKMSSIVKDFYRASEELISNAPIKEQVRLQKQLNDINDAFLNEFKATAFKDKSFTQKYGNKNFEDSFRKIFYKPSTIDEEILQDRIWSKIDLAKIFAKNRGFYGAAQVDKIMMKDSFKFIISQGLKEGMEDKTIHGLQKYLSYLRILTFEKRLGKVELF